MAIALVMEESAALIIGVKSLRNIELCEDMSCILFVSVL